MTPAQLEFNPLLAAIYALSIYGAMLALAEILLRLSAVRAAITLSSTRFGCMDGLRGVLALGVMVHHSFAAYGYFTLGVWKWSTSALLNELGQSTVAMFFMITGFLFALKASSPRLTWGAMYAARLARLGPLYAVLVFTVFVAVFIISGGTLKESVPQIIKEFLQWITFVCFGRPNVNGYRMTWTLIAGVNWSLKYEVCFYLLVVPVLHMTSKFTSTRTRLALTLAALVAMLIFQKILLHDVDHRTNALYATQFLGGILVAYAYQTPAIFKVMGSAAIKGIALVATGVLLSLVYSTNAAGVVCTTVIFAAIVGGASFGGVLRSHAAIWLGDISYGIYLMHGLALWLTLSALKVLVPHLEAIPLALYWPLMIGVAAIVVSAASVSYVILERPIMRRVTGRRREPAAQPVG